MAGHYYSGTIRADVAARKIEAVIPGRSNRCVKIEHGRLFGGLNWVGVNTGVVSARRPRWLAY